MTNCAQDFPHDHLKKISGGLNALFSTIGFVSVFFICFELLPDIWQEYRQSLKPAGSVADTSEFRIGAEDYKGKDWVPYYYVDAWKSRYKLNWHSYTYWRRAAFTSPHIKVDENGIRATWKTDEGNGKPVKIFMFGGSAMWGFGARDDYTIPSYVAKHLSETYARPVEITNFGETGYVFTQEFIALLKELQRGNIPDLVIFYDGYNDAHAAGVNGVAGFPLNEVNRHREFNILNKTNRAKFRQEAASILFHRTMGYVEKARTKIGLQGEAEKRKWASSDALHAELANVFAETTKIVMSLGETYGFKSLFFLQPTFFTKDTLSPHENNWIGQESEESRMILAAYRHVGQHPQLSNMENYVDMSRSLDHVKEVIFTDVVHMSERGNDMVSRIMLPHVLRNLPGH